MAGHASNSSNQEVKAGGSGIESSRSLWFIQDLSFFFFFKEVEEEREKEMTDTHLTLFFPTL